MGGESRDTTAEEVRVIPLRASILWRPRELRSSRSLIWSACLLWTLILAL